MRYFMNGSAIIAVAAVLVVGGSAYYEFRPPQRPTPGPPPRVPVTIIQAERADFAVYLNGLGTVQPFNTVTVRSQVDGPIVNVAFKEGQMVQAGDLLVQIDPRPFQAQLDQATAKKAQDEANLQNAILDLQRYDQLARQEGSTRQQRDTQAATVQQLEALVQADQGAIDTARLQVEYSSIRSPITGRASFIQTTLGNVVHTTDTTGIATIVQVQPISVVFAAPEDQLPAINRAFNARQVEVLALTSDGKQTLAHGSLTVVNNQIDTTSGTIQLKASFDNADNVLWSGLSVTTRLRLDTIKDAVVVPDSAIERGPDGFYVYVIDENDKAVLRDIKVGPIADGRAVIAEGVSAGQRVVTDGQYRLDKGALVAATDQTPPGVRASNERPMQKASTNSQPQPTAKD
jgi:multidrug efflux system membrane fusion protein